MEFKWTRTSRKHRIGRAHALHAMQNPAEVTEVVTNMGGLGYLIIGTDERGVELEIIVVPTDDVYLIIHVMPTAYRS